MLSTQKLNNMKKTIKTGTKHLLFRSENAHQFCEVYTNSLFIRLFVKNSFIIQSLLDSLFTKRITKNYSLWLMTEVRTEDFYFRSSSKLFLSVLSFVIRLRFKFFGFPITRDFIIRNY